VHIENPLEAERNYTFHFCYTGDPGEKELADFRAAAVALLDIANRRHVGEIDRRQCGEVVAPPVMRHPGGEARRGLILATSSLFDCRTEDLQRLETFRLRLSDILNPQFDLQQAFRADTYSGALANLGTSAGRAGEFPGAGRARGGDEDEQPSSRCRD